MTVTTLAEVCAYLDQLLMPGASSDSTGNGLILGGPAGVRRVGRGAHAATEFPGICALATPIADRFQLPWTALPEAADITGGGSAPLQYPWPAR